MRSTATLSQTTESSLPGGDTSRRNGRRLQQHLWWIHLVVWDHDHGVSCLSAAGSECLADLQRDNWEVGSTKFSAQASRTSSTNGGVTFCSGDRDRVCTSDSTCSAVGAGTCSTYFDGSGAGGYACRDQPGRTHGQALSPVYAWSNTGGVSLSTYDGGTGCAIDSYLQSGRDYINGSAMPSYTPYTYPHPLQGQGDASNKPRAGSSLQPRGE